MNIAAHPLRREHHFYVAIAKFVFLHPEYGVVSVREPIKLKYAELYGLTPLILYGLTVPGLPIRWMTFTPIMHRKALGRILREAWGSGKGLRGQPDVLRVNRHLAKASPELSTEMAKIGVQLEVAGASEKSLPASLRSAQNASMWLSKRRAQHDGPQLFTIQDLCESAQNDHNSQAKGEMRGLSNRPHEEKLQQWLSLALRQTAPIPFKDVEWEVGPWLSSWESSVPPDQPRYFNFDNLDGKTWLLSGKGPVQDFDEDYDFYNDDCYDNVAEFAKNLLACWPNPLSAAAASVGVTLRQLQWFISGKAQLERQARLQLEALLAIEYDEREGCFTARGPYALIAQNSQALEQIYLDISGGGDACPCEIVPREGSADPSWRYVLLNPYGTPPSIVMAPRGEKVMERLPDLLLNYAGIRPVSQTFYRDVVSTCARACREPTANGREMKAFAKRYEECWASSAWSPG